MANDSKDAQYQLAIQQALVEHLIETGIIDQETFQETVNKWTHKMGLDPVQNPLSFIDQKPKASDVSAAAPSASGMKSKAAVKLLIVDNVKFIRDLIRSTLSNAGYGQFFEAENGYEAVEIFDRERPDIVISDIEMKGMNGLEALEKIRQIDTTTPVIIMTGNPTENYVKEAVQFGMTDFIAKPLDVNRLLDVIAKRLGQPA